MHRSIWVLTLLLASWPAPARGQTKEVEPATARGKYLLWLEERSMLRQAERVARSISGGGAQWKYAYAAPQTRQAVRRASVWLLDYGGSVITRPNKSVVATWGDPALWEALQDIGIDLLHTGPINRSGGVEDRDYTPTTDGWFDPIALEIDPQFGTAAEYRQMVKVAGDRRGLIAGDLVPLHTGTGPDFRLAARAYKDYPGMYTMVEIGKEDWPLLPKVDDPWKGELVPKSAAVTLTKKGYLPGLVNSNDAAEDAKERSGWSATGEVVGADGKTRRWVYLTYFKRGQPVLNWLDPSYAGPRVVIGDLTNMVHNLGARVMRLDAVPFTGLEPDDRAKATTKHYQHPLSILRTKELAFMTRRLGGWTFHELNVPLKQLKKFTQDGPDLSYDFFTRAQYLHALVNGDAGPLRLAHQMLLDECVPPLGLVHDLQNHDEITYQLVELKERENETFTVNGKKTTGKALRDGMLREMRERLAGDAITYTMLYRSEKDGLATTFPGFIAASLRIRDPYGATAEQVKEIRKAHLLFAAANAMQPGVFSLSSWDLIGALPVPKEAVKKWSSDGDHRWINRGAVDLMGANPDADKSVIGLPRAKHLYGSLPNQLKDPESFASQLKTLLAARKKYRLAEADLLAAPESNERGVCLLVLRLPEKAGYAVTALNFGREPVELDLDLGAIKGLPAADVRGRRVTDIISGQAAGEVNDGRLPLRLPAITGKTLVIR
jgi:trehalose synthase